MRCQELERDLASFLDGELADPERVIVEEHLRDCETCRGSVAAQAEWKRAVRRSVPPLDPPASLVVRLGAALDVCDRERKTSTSKWHALRWPIAALCTSAAALAVFLWQPSPASVEPPVVVESIDKHQRNLPLEVQGSADVVRSWFDGKVPFAVPPPHLEPVAVLRGGRISHLGDREAAYLQYELRGRSISVFVFDPNGMHLAAPRREVIGNREVFLEGTRGFHVAVFRDQGLGYAITSSLDEPDFIRVVSVAVGGHP